MAPRERPPLTALRVAPAIRLLSLAAVFLLGGCSSDDPPTLLLAVVVDLSGPGREEGLQIRDGARLAVREATRAGAAAPELQLLIQDDRGDPRYAAHLARQLVAIPEVLAVLVAPVYAFAMTFLILRGLALVMPLRVTEHDEAVGLDIVEHGEEAYATGEGAVLVVPEGDVEPPVPVAGPS